MHSNEFTVDGCCKTQHFNITIRDFCYYRVVYHLTLDRVLLNALNFYHTVEDLSYERLDLALAVVPKTCTSMTGPYKLGFSKWEGGECSVNGLPNT